MKKIALLAVLAAATLAVDQPELPIGYVFEVSDQNADHLITNGTARIAADDEPLSPHIPAKPEKAGKVTKVRLLCDSPHGKANDVKSLPAAVAKQLCNDGQADADKAAIDYALTLPQNIDLA